MKKVLFFLSVIFILSPIFASKHRKGSLTYYYDGEFLGEGYEPDHVLFYKEMDKAAKTFKYDYVNVILTSDVKNAPKYSVLESVFAKETERGFWILSKAGQCLGLVFSDTRYPDCKNFSNYSGDAYEKAKKMFETYKKDFKL